MSYHPLFKIISKDFTPSTSGAFTTAISVKWLDLKETYLSTTTLQLLKPLLLYLPPSLTRILLH